MHERAIVKQSVQRKRQAALYSERLDQLRQLAPEEDLTLDEDSLSSFFLFLREAPFIIRRADTVGLGTDGEISATWVTENPKRILSIEFYEGRILNGVWSRHDGTVKVDQLGFDEFWKEVEEELRDILV